jgi:hypothetical protein
MTAPEAKLEYRIGRDEDKFVAIDSDEETVALRTSEPMKLSIYGNNIGNLLRQRRRGRKR